MEVLDKIAEPALVSTIDKIGPVPAKIGTWHGSHTAGFLTATGTVTGCGLMQLYGIYNYAPSNFGTAVASNIQRENNLKRDLESLKKLCGQKEGNQYKCRTFICTMGNYNGTPDTLKMMENVGFKEIAHYINAAHEYNGPDGSTTDWQKLFILSW